MPRGVYQIEQILVSLVMIVHGDCLSLYGDAPFPLDFELVEELAAGVLGDGVGDFEEAVGKS